MNSQVLDTLPTFKLMMEYKAIMLESIRSMDTYGESYVREYDFNAAVFKCLKTLEGDTTQQNAVRVAFSKDNLINSHILSDFDHFEGAGRLFFDKAVLDIFRLFDRSLIQELTHIELNTRLVALRELTDRFDSGSLDFNPQDLDYKEALGALFRALAALQSLIRRNLTRMEDVNRDLSEQSEKALKAANPNVVQALQKDNIEHISNLLVRHILPTRAFLDEKVVLRDGANLLACLEKLKRLFEVHSLDSEASTMLRYAISFNAYHKDISRISTSIDQFLARSRKRLTQFNAIENAFSELVEYLKETQQDLRRKRISSDFAQTSGLFCGLMNQPRPKDLRLSDSQSYFNNITTDITTKLEDYKLVNQLDLSLLQSSKDNSLDTRLERVKQVKQLMYSMRFKHCDDLIKVVSDRLEGLLDDYQILDLLEALMTLNSVGQLNLHNHLPRVTNIFHEITVGGYVFKYRKIKLEVRETYAYD